MRPKQNNPQKAQRQQPIKLLMESQKAWAKLKGSYGDTKAGSPHEVLNTFSIAPCYNFSVHEELDEEDDPHAGHNHFRSLQDHEDEVDIESAVAWRFGVSILGGFLLPVAFTLIFPHHHESRPCEHCEDRKSMIATMHRQEQLLKLLSASQPSSGKLETSPDLASPEEDPGPSLKDDGTKESNATVDSNECCHDNHHHHHGDECCDEEDCHHHHDAHDVEPPKCISPGDEEAPAG